MAATEPNTDQIAFWRGKAGEKWVRYQVEQDATIRVFGERAMAAAAVAPGERVLDVGCGCADTTLALGRRVGPQGSVLGIDVSTVMLDHAGTRAAGLNNVTFENADAQSHALPAAAFDVMMSRFGVMFFADPAAAFANFRQALRPGGRVAFACWRARAENLYFHLPVTVAARHVEFPPPPTDPEAPGIFSFAAADRVRRILTDAGLTDIAIDRFDTELTPAGTPDLDAAVAFLMRIGPMAAALEGATEATVAAIRADLHDAVAPYHTSAGVKLPASSWIVTARRG